VNVTVMTVYLSGPGGGLRMDVGSMPALPSRTGVLLLPAARAASGAEVSRVKAEPKRAETIRRRFTNRLDMLLGFEEDRSRALQLFIGIQWQCPTGAGHCWEGNRHSWG
jgi:hypothetical protein